MMRMDLVGARDLVDRLAAGQRFQRHFRFKLRTEHFSLHRSSPPVLAVLPVQSTTLILLCQIHVFDFYQQIRIIQP